MQDDHTKQIHRVKYAPDEFLNPCITLIFFTGLELKDADLRLSFDQHIT